MHSQCMWLGGFSRTSTATSHPGIESAHPGSHPGENTCSQQFPGLFTGLGTIQESFEIKLKPDAQAFALFTPRNVPIPVLVITFGHRTISGQLCRVTYHTRTRAEKMSRQKRGAVASETNVVPPKKCRVTVETV